MCARDSLDQLLVELDDIASPRQKLLSGLAEGLPLYGHELIGRWQARVRAYPEPFRLEMIQRHWNFFPLWYHGEAMSLRDTELWRLDVLLEGVFNLLGVLAAINRVYFARFELKRNRDLISKMTVAPPHLADRIEALVHLPAQDAHKNLDSSSRRPGSLSHAKSRTLWSNCRSRSMRASNLGAYP